MIRKIVFERLLWLREAASLKPWLGVGLIGLLLTACQPSSPLLSPSNAVLLEITASDCEACRQIHPIVQTLRDQTQNSGLTVLIVDVSDTFAKNGALESCKEVNCHNAMKSRLDRAGHVVLINRITGRVVDELTNETRPSSYEAMLTEHLGEAIFQPETAE